MKWVLAKYPSASVHKYQLEEDSAVKVVLKYNHTQQSTRISSDGNHRLFFAELTGLWNNKVIFTSEYGVESGKLVFERGHHTGTVEIADKKYQFIINNNNVPELVLFKRNISKPVAVCDLALDGLRLSATLNDKETNLEIASLLLGLCWYLVPAAAAGKVELVTVPVS